MWFTDEGNTGKLSIESDGDGWFVVSPGDVGETRCLVSGDLDLDESGGPQEVEIAVDSFRWGVGSSSNILSVSHVGDANSHKARDSNNSTPDSKRDANQSKSSNESRKLKDFTGSGDYVDVEATIDVVFFVKKETSGVPDVKGELTDDSVRKPVTFIVEDGVKHPYLGEGNRFHFENVKDHFYKGNAEVQVVINRNTRYTELD